MLYYCRHHLLTTCCTTVSSFIGYRMYYCLHQLLTTWCTANSICCLHQLLTTCCTDSTISWCGLIILNPSSTDITLFEWLRYLPIACSNADSIVFVLLTTCFTVDTIKYKLHVLQLSPSTNGYILYCSHHHLLTPLPTDYMLYCWRYHLLFCCGFQYLLVYAQALLTPSSIYVMSITYSFHLYAEFIQHMCSAIIILWCPQFFLIFFFNIIFF